MKKSQITVYLYDEPKSTRLDTKSIKNYLEEKTSLKVRLRPAIFDFFVSSRKPGERELEKWAQKLAQTKIRDVSRVSSLAPLKGEIEYEIRRLLDHSIKSFGLLYDGFPLVSLFFNLLPEEEQNGRFIHIIFTNQLIGTWDKVSARYHARVAVLSFPSIISTTGVVEAPAKPKEYYWLKQQVLSLGFDPETLEDFKKARNNELLEHEDQRITEVLKGYALQAILHHFEDEPFCKDQNCRLFNAHWQKEVIRAQLEGEYELCPEHEKFFQDLKELRWQG